MDLQQWIDSVGPLDAVAMEAARQRQTMLAKRIPGILPPLTLEESLEVTSVASVAGVLEEGRPLVRMRPFRSPHHTISRAALIGGSSNPRPGLNLSGPHNSAPDFRTAFRFFLSVQTCYIHCL